MLPAQIIKDASMANKVTELIKTGQPDTTYYVICGMGHMQYGYGVPERIWAANEALKQSTSMVVAYELDGVKFDVDKEHLEAQFGTEVSPADYCFLFESAQEEEDVKGETAAAYDKVGDTAHREGNLKKAGPRRHHLFPHKGGGIRSTNALQDCQKIAYKLLLLRPFFTLKAF